MTKSRMELSYKLVWSPSGYSTTQSRLITAMMLAVLAATPIAAAQEPVLELTGVETDGGPLDLPGHPKPPLTRQAQETPSPAASEQPEWLGGKPFLEWSRATGDWGGARACLERAGLTINGSLTYDWSGVFSGGLRNVASTRSLLDVNALLDSEKLVGLKGNTVFADFQSSDVRGGSRDVGDVQGVSNIDSGENVHQLSEIWCEQRLCDNLLRIKVGKIDANKEFDALVSTGNFLHSCAGLSPTILTFPTYPDPAFGAVLFLYPTDRLYIGTGLFDGSLADGVHTGRLGPASLVDGGEYFAVVEVGLTWMQTGNGGNGRIAAGGWVNTAHFTLVDGSSHRATGGPYLLAEQQLCLRTGCEDQADKGVFLFARYGYSDPDIGAIANHVEIGVSLGGTLPGRDADAAGLLVSYADLGEMNHRDETAVEAFYKLSITSFLTVSPDLQVIINPGNVPDDDVAWVGALRFQLAF